MGKGQIYILSNPALEGFVKIGYAGDGNVKSRLGTLNSAVPYHFRVCALYETDTDTRSDLLLHRLITTINPELRASAIDENSGKPYSSEFFKMSPEDACSVLKNIAIITGTESRLTICSSLSPQEQYEEKDAEDARERYNQSQFRFSFIGLGTGDEVQFKGDSTISATICDDKHVIYEGEEYSLSKLAQKLTGTDSSLRGPAYFTYDGEALTDRRVRMEQEDEQKTCDATDEE